MLCSSMMLCTLQLLKSSIPDMVTFKCWMKWLKTPKPKHIDLAVTQTMVNEWNSYWHLLRCLLCLGKGKKMVRHFETTKPDCTYQVVTVRESEQGTARINMTWSWAASDLVRLLCCHWLAAAHRVLLLMLVTLVLILLQPTASTEWLLGFQWNCSEENIRLKNYCVGLLCSNLDLISSNVFTIFF